MTNEQIFRLAELAGLPRDTFDNQECDCDECNFLREPLLGFALMLVEGCAKVGVALPKIPKRLKSTEEQDAFLWGWKIGASDVRAAIQQREID